MSASPDPTGPAAATGSGPLQGIRVIDLTSVVMGPYASQVLADYGADVVKVESPQGDTSRQVGPAREPGRGAQFLAVNRNKRSVVLDLKRSPARAALLRLVGTADVFLHSLRPAKIRALGLGPDRLLADQPRLIYVELTGFGSAGRYAGQPAYDDIVQSLCGIGDLMTSVTGEPAYLPTIAADKVTGLTAVHAILAALLQRERLGRGRRIEVPLFEAMTSFLLVEHYFGGHLVPPAAPDAELGYPRASGWWRRPYPTVDGHVCLMPYTDAQWQRFWPAAGAAALATDPRFATLADRGRNGDELYRTAAAVIATRTTASWLELCRQVDVPAAPVQRLADIATDPHLHDVGMFVTSGGYSFVRSPITADGWQPRVTVPPALGADTVAVLREAGLPEAEVADLLADGSAVQHRAD